MPERKSAKQEADVGQKEEKQERDVSERPTEGSPVAVIYLGPPISGVSMPGTVYRNGLPPQTQKMLEEIPALGRLLVSVGNAAQIRKELQDPQSAASICYQKVVEHVKKGAKG